MPERLTYACDFDRIGREAEDSGKSTLESVRRVAEKGNLRLASDEESNLFGSLTERPNVHLPVLDLDIPHRYVPSSTEGHGHLYLDVEVSTANLKRMVDLLAELGVLQEGIKHQLAAHGTLLVRKPGVKKVVA